MGPAAKKALRYGPYVQQAWKHAGKPAQEAAQKSLSGYVARRTALQHADTVVAGSVLSVMHAGARVWVVFSADEPVTAYPSVSSPLSELVAHADLTKRLTPDEARERQRGHVLRERARERVRRLRGRERHAELPTDPEDEDR